MYTTKVDGKTLTCWGRTAEVIKELDNLGLLKDLKYFKNTKEIEEYLGRVNPNKFRNTPFEEHPLP